MSLGPLPSLSFRPGAGVLAKDAGYMYGQVDASTLEVFFTSE